MYSKLIFSVTQHIELNTGEYSHVPIFHPTEGNIRIRNVHFMPMKTTPVDTGDYREFHLEVKDKQGNDKREIKLTNCANNVLPFTDGYTMTWPPVGQFNEIVLYTETLHLGWDVSGTTGDLPDMDFYLQVDYHQMGE